MTFFRKYLYAAWAILFIGTTTHCTQAQPTPKPRIIVTTDGEFDDRCSMVRFLLYANEFDIQGIIHSSSKFHWKGNDTTESHQWRDVSWMDEHLAAYAQVHPNLIQHDADFPDPGILRQRVYEGNTELAGDMAKETPGSDRIVEVLLQPDTTAVWLQAWGGSNTIARALKTIEEKHPERKAEVMKKARLFLILLQDSTYESYIAPHWPQLTTLLSTAFESIGYPWKKRVPALYRDYYLGAWMNPNVLSDHGPLLDIYRKHLYGGDRTTGDFISEGDSPAFMHVIPTGLRSDQDPAWGGWGGRFYWDENLWRSAPDDGDKFKAIYRWIPDYQRDFAARADWCVKGFEEANHAPQITTKAPDDRRVQPGEQIELSVQASDPDGDALQYTWWRYVDADTYSRPLSIPQASQPTIRLTIPQDVKPSETIHLICQVADQGKPALTSYQRVVLLVTVRE